MKDLGYYMSLPYEIKVRELSDDDGGGILMSIPLLGDAAVRGYGDTYSEARTKLECVKRDFLEIWLNKGLEIPEPETESYIDNTEIYTRELAAVGI